MDSSDFPVGRSPRKELQGPRPPALKVRKDSHKIKKPPVAPQPPQNHHQTQPRPPVIIYTVSPKVIHTNPSDFMNLVQRLTGSSSSSSSSSSTSNNASYTTPPNPFPNVSGAISPASRFASIEKTRSPKPRMVSQQQAIGGDAGFLEGIEMSQVMERSSNSFPGILSPGPASLPPISPNFFFSPPTDPNMLSFLHDLSPLLHSNRNPIEGSFMPSPSTFVSPTPSMDLFNNFNNFFDF